MKKAILLFIFVFQIYTSYSANCVVGQLVVDTVISDCCLETDDEILITIVPTSPPSCTISYWRWYMGDGVIIDKPGNDFSITYSYSNPGVYTILAIPYNAANQPLNDPQSINLSTIIKYYPPSHCNECAVITYDYSNFNCLSTVTFFSANLSINICSYDSVIIAWDFGDPLSGESNYSSLEDPKHVFSDSGLYYVTVKAIVYIGTDSCSATFSQTVNTSLGITEFLYPNQLMVNPNPSLGGSSVQLICSGPFASGTIYFGDGQSSVWNFSDTLYHTYPMVDSVVSYNILIEFPSECDLELVYEIVVYPPFTTLPCDDCISSFNPEQGKRYLVSAWVKEEGAAPTVTSYSSPALFLSFSDNSSPIVSLPNMYPKGILIDGWQRIEEEFTVPINAAFIDINLVCSTGNCLFDDIRVFPYDGTMKSYVYDPVSLRLMAELDERNYATMYEYDEEGKLVRVKKETERGIMTIKENRNNTSKHQFGQ